MKMQAKLIKSRDQNEEKLAADNVGHLTRDSAKYISFIKPENHTRTKRVIYTTALHWKFTHLFTSGLTLRLTPSFSQ